VQAYDFRRIFEVLRGTRILPDTAPQRLHHYTDLEGLMGIFDTGELWATDVRFMNDTSEYDHANEMVAAELKSLGAHILPLSEPPFPEPDEEGNIIIGEEYATRVGMRKVAADLLESTGQRLLKPQFRTYVSCFCDSGDLLRQWRAYASGGYSLEFDGSLLSGRYQGSHPTTLLARVEYSEDNQKELIRSLLRTHFPKYLSSALTGANKGAIDLVVTGTNAVLLARACLKSDAFEDEREWRILTLGPLESATEKFRASKGLPLPYHPIDIKFPNLPITGIMVGPGPQQERKQRAIERFVGKQGHIKVTRSEIPVLL